MADHREKRGQNGGQERHERRSLDSKQAAQNAAVIVWVMKEIAEIVNSVSEIELVEPKEIVPMDRDGWKGELTVSGWQRTDFYEECKPLAYELGNRLGVDIVLRTRIVTDQRLARIEALVKKAAEKFAGSEVEVTSEVFRRQPKKDDDRVHLALAFDLKTMDSDSKGRVVGTGGKNVNALRRALRFLACCIGLTGGAEMEIEVKRESVPVSKSETGPVGEDDTRTAESTGSADSTPTSAGA